MKMLGQTFVSRLGGCTLHTYMAPEDGEMVCSHIVETPRSLVIVDVQLLDAYAREVRAYADGLGKPIDRVIVTHAHPDHWMGLDRFADRPTYALPEVITELDQRADWWLKTKRQQVGDRVTGRKVLPSLEVREGVEDVDGVRFRFRGESGGESSATLLIDLPRESLLLAQDLVYNKVHLFFGELRGPNRDIQCFDDWTRQLRELQREDYAKVAAGHGEPTDASAFGVAIEYLTEVRSMLTGTRDFVELKRRIVERYPEYRVPAIIDYSTMSLAYVG